MLRTNIINEHNTLVKLVVQLEQIINYLKGNN